MKKILLLSILAVVGVVFGFGDITESYADKIKPPNFVDQKTTSNVEAAGKEVNSWLLVIFAVTVALSSLRPGFYFVTGQAEKGWEHSKEILIGAVVGVLLSAIVFAIINAAS